MPLVKSGSKAAVGKNIQKEMSAGKPQNQAVAIALETQRRYSPQAARMAKHKRRKAYVAEAAGKR